METWIKIIMFFALFIFIIAGLAVSVSAVFYYFLTDKNFDLSKPHDDFD